jgi:hypothetical protein
MQKNRMKKQTQFHPLSEAKSRFIGIIARSKATKQSQPQRHPNPQLKKQTQFVKIRVDSWLTIASLFQTRLKKQTQFPTSSALCQQASQNKPNLHLMSERSGDPVYIGKKTKPILINP